MKKLTKTLTAVIMATAMAASMAVSVSAATCPPHITTSQYIGIAYDQAAGTRQYVYEVRAHEDGTVEQIMATCTMRAIGTRYGYVCTKCGTVTSTWVSNSVRHSSCGK